MTHSNDLKVLNVAEAAVLADEYVLMHGDSYDRLQSPLRPSFSAPRSPVLQKLSGDGGMTSGGREGVGVKESDMFFFFVRSVVILLTAVLL